MFKRMSIEEKIRDLSERGDCLWPPSTPDDDMITICMSFSGPRYDNLVQAWFSRWGRKGYMSDKKAERHIGDGNTLDAALNSLDFLLTLEEECQTALDIEREAILSNVPFSD